jgi:hypothetical protein
MNIWVIVSISLLISGFLLGSNLTVVRESTLSSVTYEGVSVLCAKNDGVNYITLVNLRKKVIKSVTCKDGALFGSDQISSKGDGL